MNDELVDDPPEYEPDPETAACGLCGGSGLCPECGGLIYDAIEGNDCPLCDGTETCPACGGSGAAADVTARAG